MQNDTCDLYWTTNTILVAGASNFTNDIPTNFPTRNLRIWIWTQGLTNSVFRLPVFNPGREADIQFNIMYAGDRSSSNYVGINVGRFLAVRANTKYGVFAKYSFSPHTRSWIPTIWYGSSGESYYNDITADGGTDRKGSLIPTNAPATVEEWLALHPEWASP